VSEKETPIICVPKKEVTIAEEKNDIINIFVICILLLLLNHLVWVGYIACMEMRNARKGRIMRPGQR
jgi:hypothetical protein